MLYWCVVLMVLSEANGVILSPVAYTFTPCSSNPNRTVEATNCPTMCANDGICECIDNITSGVLFDNVIPILNVSQRGSWASDLYAICNNELSVFVGSKFNAPVTFHTVLISMFICYEWHLPGVDLEISIFSTQNFHSLIHSQMLGHIFVDMEYNNCNSLTTISVNMLDNVARDQFVIQFRRSSSVGYIYIGEIQFRDEAMTSFVTEYPTSAQASTSIYQASSNNMISQVTTLMRTDASEMVAIINASKMPYKTSFKEFSQTTVTIQENTSTGGESNDNTIMPTAYDEVSFNHMNAVSQYVSNSIISVLQVSDVNNNSTRTSAGNERIIIIAIYASLGCITFFGAVGLIVTSGIIMKHYRKQSHKSQEITRIPSNVEMDSVTPVSDLKNDFDLIDDNENTSQHIEHAVNNLYEATQPSDTSLEITHVTNGTRFVPSIQKKVSRSRPLKQSSTTSVAQCSESSMLNDSGYVPPDEGKQKLQSVTNLADNPQYESVTVRKREETVHCPNNTSATVGTRFYSSFRKKASLSRSLKQSSTTSVVPCSESSMLNNSGYVPLGEGNQNLKGVTCVTNRTNWADNPQYESVTVKKGEEIIHCSENASATIATRFVSSLRRKASLSRSRKHSSTKAAVQCSDSSILNNTGYVPLGEENQNLQSTPCTNHTNWTENPKYELTFKNEEETLYSPIYQPLSSLSDVNVIPLYQPEDIKVIKTLGLGFFGKVLLAEIVNSHDSTSADPNFHSVHRGNKVAIKMLKADCSISIKLAFYKELKFMSRLQHENVVRVLGACTSDEPFIVMEYIEKGALNSYLQNYDEISTTSGDETSDFIIHVDTLVRMCTQIACGMKYLSTKNYIHRDLAARNVLVGDDDAVKISDFGMSRNLYASHYYIMESRGAVPIRWMARECFSKKFSTKSDVWSFGVTMWEIFTLGKIAPYEDMTDLEVLQDAIKAERQLLSIPDKCPSDIYGIMLECWGIEASDRPNFDVLYDMLLPLNSTDNQNV